MFFHTMNIHCLICCGIKVRYSGVSLFHFCSERCSILHSADWGVAKVFPPSRLQL